MNIIASISTKFYITLKDEVDKLNEQKRILPLATLQGLIFTTRNFVLLCERLLNELDYVCLKTFSQDVLEAFFGNLVGSIFLVLLYS